MYQRQLTQLLLAFNAMADRSYPINRLLNDSDYRNQCLSRELKRSANGLATLVRQIRAVEDLLAHELRVDVLNPKHGLPRSQPKKTGWLAAFGLCGMLLMLGSVWLTADLKQQRQSQTANPHQAD